jgi:predicted esterase|tara:strand:+ start:543 stop:1160 length:618 start_codon:yes stop_codon:yes gene_type:complete
MKTISCSGKHGATVIILHGLYQDTKEISWMINKINCDFIKWIILEGKSLKWYNYYTQRDNHYRHDKINYRQFTHSCRCLKNTIKRELRYIASKNLYIVGISQGGTVCINTALSLKFNLGGVICIDTIFLSDYMSDVSFFKQKFYILISSNDKIYNPNFQKICYNLLRFFGNEINVTERNKKHCEDMKEICNYIHFVLQKNNLLKK